MKLERKFTLTLITLLAVFTMIQFDHPAISNAKPAAEIAAPAEVKAIFKRACYDCHSNETNLRWYDEIAPVYWQVAAHVKAGREGLNFSTLDKMPPADQKAKLWEAVNQIIAGAMPLKSYAFVHRGARISTQDLVILKAYVKTLAPKIKGGDTTKENALNAQLHLENDTTKEMPVALNGIAYLPDYKNWQVISTTDRFDNGTMRAIVGNEIAVKAIQQNHLHPWPNGSILAKVAWEQREDRDGIIKSGSFKQVEYMIKNAQQYASTGGWGFARFKTNKLVPYGQTALFATECINCHRPQKDEDFVFTRPIAPLPAVHELPLKTTASFIDKKAGTMSVLYIQGNARTLITRKLKADESWFGANVPGGLLSVEKVSTGPVTAYKNYNAKGLLVGLDKLAQKRRISYILRQHTSDLP